MTNKRQITATLAVAVIAITVVGIGMGGVSGQILSEVNYYDEDFTEYNESAIQIAPDDDLQNQHLVNPSDWTPDHYSISHDGYDWSNETTYGDTDAHYNNWHSHDTSYPWLQGVWRGDSSGSVGIYRQFEVPDGMDNPTLVIEHSHYNTDNRDDRHEVGYYDFDRHTGKIHTTDTYDGRPGWMASRVLVSGDDIQGNFSKAGSYENTDRQSWKTSTFEVPSTANNITVVKANRMYSNGNDRSTVNIKEVYWREGSDDAFQAEVNGYQSIAEDDSFGGPDPYPLTLINENTANGEQVSLRSQASSITKEYTFDGISEAQTTYFVIEGSSNSQKPVQYSIEAFGQEVAAGSIAPQSTSEETVELDLETDEITLKVNSEGQYDIHSVSVSTLEQTSAGDPLATNTQPGGITLNAQEGYDRTVGVFITALGLTTDTLIYVLMIALALGAVAFTFSKSVRGQEFAQSMMMGAAIAGVIILGVVPVMNMATWIFTGDTQRAPLADPALEAEPPTYYSTEFQAGTMDGWSFDNARGQGSARPVSVGESFDVVFSGSASNSGIITHQEHISLGNSLGTGFVNIEGATTGTAGKTGPVHEVTFNVRVYTTDDGELEDSEMLDPNKNYIDEEGTVGAEGAAELRDRGESQHIAYVGEVARSFDGQTQQAEHLATFDLDGEYVHTELIVQDNRGDENSQGTLSSVRVGATTQGGSVDHS